MHDCKVQKLDGLHEFLAQPAQRVTLRSITIFYIPAKMRNRTAHQSEIDIGLAADHGTNDRTGFRGLRFWQIQDLFRDESKGWRDETYLAGLSARD